MEKKYYDIIVSIVKQNDKYAGCEPILDDIVQDVYDHSKVVLGSVTNEDVINAYLNKVVATSLITVPKKLNFNTRNKHRIISNVEAITNVSIPTKPVEPQIEEVPLETFASAPVTEELTFEKELPAETVEEQVAAEPEFEFTTDDTEMPLDSAEEEELAEEFVIEEPIETSFEFEEPADIENVEPQIDEIIEEEPALEENDTFNFIEEEEEDTVEDFSAELTEEPEFIVAAPEQDVDKTLVDKMINGVESEPDEPEELPLMEESVSLENEITDLESDNTFETFDSFETEEVSLEEEHELIEEPVNEVVEEFSFVEEPVLIQEEEEEDNSFLSMEEPMTLSLEENDSFELDEPKDLHEEEAVLAIEETESDCTLPDFGCFSYEPETPEFDEEEICADLKELDSKHPEKKLLQICKLKYEDKQTVAEIAQTLDFSEEAVVDTLNDIIELVKD